MRAETQNIVADIEKSLALLAQRMDWETASHRLEEFNEIDRQRLEVLKDRLKDIGNAQIDVKISYGSPIEEILKRAKIEEASLVIMGSRGRGFVSELFLGSVSHNVVRHSEAPVLLISSQRRDT